MADSSLYNIMSICGKKYLGNDYIAQIWCIGEHKPHLNSVYIIILCVVSLICIPLTHTAMGVSVSMYLLGIR